MNMNIRLARLSSAVLTSIRKSTHLSSGSSILSISANSDAEKPTLPFSAMPYEKRATPTESEIQEALKEWESTINTEQLTALEKRIHDAHMRAVRKQEEMYQDPVTDFHVYTSYGHLSRGSCCGNVCRHCPYDHQNVSARYKSIKKNNGAFYC